MEHAEGVMFSKEGIIISMWRYEFSTGFPAGYTSTLLPCYATVPSEVMVKNLQLTLRDCKYDPCSYAFLLIQPQTVPGKLVSHSVVLGHLDTHANFEP